MDFIHIKYFDYICFNFSKHYVVYTCAKAFFSHIIHTNLVKFT